MGERHQYRGYRFRLAATAEQMALIGQFSSVCRAIYNAALEQRRDWWRHHKRCTGSAISFASQCRELTELRREFDWIAAVPRMMQEQALRDLDAAYANFFSRRTAYPSFRRRGVGESFRVRREELIIRPLNAKWCEVRLPKIGWVKYRSTRPLRGQVRFATVSLDQLGWHISFCCVMEAPQIQTVRPDVGIDRGVANTLALSTGEMLSVPAQLEILERRQRGAQKVLARRKRGSNRRAKAARRVAALAAKQARMRRDWQHKATNSISARFGRVVMEDLRVKDMTASASEMHIRQKAGLNRSILNQGWGAFASILAYKLEERGGSLVLVDPAYTSQACSECGIVDRESRKSQAAFVCQHCGFRAHADHNAAINILRRNTASMRVEDGHRAADEARTNNRADSMGMLICSASALKLGVHGRR